MFRLRTFSLSLFILIGNIPCSYGYPPSHENTNRTNGQNVQQAHSYGLYLLAGVIIAGILWNKAGLSIDDFVDYCQNPAKVGRALNTWWNTHRAQTFSHPSTPANNQAPNSGISQPSPQAQTPQQPTRQPQPDTHTPHAQATQHTERHREPYTYTPQAQAAQSRQQSQRQPRAEAPRPPHAQPTAARPQQTPATQTPSQSRQAARIIAQAAARQAHASRPAQTPQAQAAQPVQAPQTSQNPEVLLRSWGYDIIDRYPGRRIWQARSATQLPGGWACGAFSLHNAHNIEGILGLNRIPNGLQALGQASARRGIQLAGGIDNHTLVDLARDLQLHDFYAVQIDSTGQLVPLFNSTSNMRFNSTVHTPRGQATVGLHTMDVDVTVPYHWSERSAKQYADQIFKAKCRELLEAARDRLLSQDQQPHVTHFGCILPEHVVLASAIKLPGQQPFIVLLDNINERLDHNALTRDQLVQIADLVGA